MNRRERRVNDRLDGTLWGEGRKREQEFRKAIEFYRQEHLEGREHGLTTEVSAAVFNGWRHTCQGVEGVVHPLTTSNRPSQGFNVRNIG